MGKNFQDNPPFYPTSKNECESLPKANSNGRTNNDDSPYRNGTARKKVVCRKERKGGRKKERKKIEIDRDREVQCCKRRETVKKEGVKKRAEAEAEGKGKGKQDSQGSVPWAP